ncbi:MAG TPA: orotidine-5'-phosphate decarboxylase [Gemmatimonadaceae bacterium]|nr:orotidine-5'-phosphate decarboxylase [Gemmatimonadaceae bacterium]
MTTIPIVALDVADQDAALGIVDQLGESCRFYKIGAELFTACGPSVVREVQARDSQVFLDLKYHDIPNTVAGAVRRAAALGVRLLTVHASGGVEMLRAAVDAAGDPARCGVLGVTVLTSLDGATLGELWGRGAPVRVADEVLRLAEAAREASAAGIVCSGAEAPLVKSHFGSALSVLIPGIRMPGGASHDQARVSTPADAAAAGADYVVVGRAITAARDRRAAMTEMLAQLA